MDVRMARREKGQVNAENCRVVGSSGVDRYMESAEMSERVHVSQCRRGQLAVAALYLRWHS